MSNGQAQKTLKIIESENRREEKKLNERNRNRNDLKTELSWSVTHGRSRNGIVHRKC